MSTDSLGFNRRLGLRLFSIYSCIYLGFVVLCGFAPAAMEWQPIEGLNLAIVYGFALILFALVFAIVYGLFCRREDLLGDAELLDPSVQTKGDLE